MRRFSYATSFTKNQKYFVILLDLCIDCKKSIILENIATNQILNTSITPKHLDSKALLVFIVQKLPIFNQIIFRFSEYMNRETSPQQPSLFRPILIFQIIQNLYVDVVASLFNGSYFFFLSPFPQITVFSVESLSNVIKDMHNR